jgi:low molecular weight protein-tyrosine phosphatase
VESTSLDVVFVCTGNQFRSPLAEAIFAREAEGLPVRVSSRGTAAMEGGAVFEEAAALGRRLRVDLSGHRSRRLGRLAEADLVIGFERHHVVRAVIEAGAPRDRTFTLPQLVELLEAAPHEGSARERLDAVRPENMLGAPEIEDPIGLPRAEQEKVLDEVEDLARRLVVALFR